MCVYSCYIVIVVPETTDPNVEITHFRCWMCCNFLLTLKVTDGETSLFDLPKTSYIICAHSLTPYLPYRHTLHETTVL